MDNDDKNAPQKGKLLNDVKTDKAEPLECSLRTPENP